MEKYRLSDKCIVDIETGEGENNGKAFHLENEARVILELLIKRKGTVVTKKIIASKLWDRPFHDYDSTIIHTQLSNIRKNLGRDIIKTIYGSGYKIEKAELIESSEEAEDTEATKNADEAKADSKTVADEIYDFEQKLRRCASNLLNQWNQRQNYQIEENLLPKCTIAGRDFSCLYEGLKVLFEQKKTRNCIIQAVGGSGKTSSLVHACERMLECNEIIPVFIQLRFVSIREKSLSSYLHRNFVDTIKTDNSVETFTDSLSSFLRESGKKLMVVLDGCNECSSEVLNDISDIQSIDNTVVIATSRVDNRIFSDYMNIKLHAIDRRGLKKYLKEYLHNEKINIKMAEGFLDRPLYISMFAQLATANDNVREKLASIDNPGKLIGLWLENDISKHSTKVRDTGEDNVAMMEYIVPLVSMAMFLDMGYEEHNSLVINNSACINAIAKVVKYIDESNIYMNYLLLSGIDLRKYSEDKCLQLIYNTVINVFGLWNLETKNGRGSSFWIHECYRDWFIAKGLEIVCNHDDELSKEFLNIFINDKFRYPRVWKEYKDYACYNVAVYLSELLGRETLVSVDDTNIHCLVRNIAFFADDLGQSDRVVECVDCMSKRDENPDIKISLSQRAVALNGMGKILLTLADIDERKDKEDFINKAYVYLSEARKCVEKLVDCQNINVDNFSDKEIMSMTSDDVDARINQVLTGSANVFPTQFIVGDCEDDIRYVLSSLARIYTNMGLYYDKVFENDNDKKHLVLAHRLRLTGALIKYYLGGVGPDDIILGQKHSETIHLSYRGLGSDLFNYRKYDAADDFYNFAMKNCEACDAEVLRTRVAYIRNKAAMILSGTRKYTISSIIAEQKEVVELAYKNMTIADIIHSKEAVILMRECIEKGYGTAEDTIAFNELVDSIDSILSDLSVCYDFKEKELVRRRL